MREPRTIEQRIADDMADERKHGGRVPLFTKGHLYSGIGAAVILFALQALLHPAQQKSQSIQGGERTVSEPAAPTGPHPRPLQ